jgi:type II secretory pathway component PulK
MRAMKMNSKNDLSKILKNERGVALMMVMTAIIILMAIYGDFTFESKISRIKATNILDRAQAKLMAESGLQMAMTRLRLYKEAFNYLQGNANAKSAVPAQMLNQLWEVPFIYPLPVGASANATFKDAAAKFEKETLLEGEMKVSIQNISSRMNLNLLRLDMAKYVPQADGTTPTMETSAINLSDQAIATDVSVDQSLYFLLKRLVQERGQKDEAFEARYGGLNYQELITNLKYYMSDYNSLSSDPLIGPAEADFQKIPLTPKYGPMSSSSEMYAIPAWTDELIEMIQNEFSVYPSTQIDLNKVTANMLKIIIPTMTDDDIKEFFIYRDDPVNPKVFNSKDDFKKYIVDQERLMGGSDFDSRMKLFEDKGITFGSNPNLFKVVSVGTFNRANYTLVAYVSLPAPKAVTPAAATATAATDPLQPPPLAGNTTPTNPAATQNTQLLEPRIIELQIN